MDLQARMNQSFEDYFTVTEEVRSDVEMLLDVNKSGLIKDSDIRWKKNLCVLWLQSLRDIAICFVKLHQMSLYLNLRSFQKRKKKF